MVINYFLLTTFISVPTTKSGKFTGEELSVLATGEATRIMLHKLLSAIISNVFNKSIAFVSN